VKSKSPLISKKQRRLQRLPIELLQIILEIPIGATSFESASNLLRKNDYSELLELQQLQQWLEEEIKHYESSEMAQDIHLIPEEELQSKIFDLQENLYHLATRKSAHLLLSERLRQIPIFLNYVFPKEGESQQTPQDKQIKMATISRDRHVTEVLKLHQSISSLKDQIHTSRMESARLSKENRDIYSEISKQSKKFGSTELNELVETLENDIKVRKARNFIVRNVLQNLILESGVNWAQDEELRNVFLGKEIV